MYTDLDGRFKKEIGEFTQTAMRLLEFFRIKPADEFSQVCFQCSRLITQILQNKIYEKFTGLAKDRTQIINLAVSHLWLESHL